MIIPWGGDLTTQYLPWYFTAANYLHSFSLPHWVPNIYGRGYPLMAEGETGVLSPINWFFLFFFPFGLAINLLYLTYFLISILSTFYFLKANKLSRLSSLLGGLVFGLSGFMVSRYFQPAIIFSSALMPLGFFVILKSATSFRWIFLLPFVIYLQITAGHLQIALISCLGYLAFTFFYFLKSKEGVYLILKIPLIMFIGFGLAAPQIMPSFKLFQISERKNWDFKIRYSYSLPSSYLLTYVKPYAFGISEPGNNFGFKGFGGSFWEFNLTIWTLPFLLSIIGIATLKEKKAKLTAVLILIWLTFLLLSFGGYFKPYRVVGHLPSFPFRVPARFLILCTFAAAGLVAIGFEKLFGKKSQVIQILIISIVVLSIFFQQQLMFKQYFKFIDSREIEREFRDLSKYKMTTPLDIDPAARIDNYYSQENHVFQEEFRKGIIIALASLTAVYLWYRKSKRP